MDPPARPPALISGASKLSELAQASYLTDQASDTSRGQFRWSGVHNVIVVPEFDRCYEGAQLPSSALGMQTVWLS
jgi:hypothetical protein